MAVGRGATGRLLSLEFLEFVFFESLGRFTLVRGVVFALSVVAFAFGRFTFAGRFVFVLLFVLRFVLLFVLRFVLLFELRFVFVLLLTLPFVFSLAFRFFGFRGLLSFEFAEVFELRFSFGSSAGVTVSGVSPAFVGRLMSMATV